MPSNPKTLKVKTSRGGFRHDIATSWNSKLLTKRKRSRIGDVPLEMLYRDIDAGYRIFWARRRVLP
jgi:hypothetical protein